MPITTSLLRKLEQRANDRMGVEVTIPILYVFDEGSDAPQTEFEFRKRYPVSTHPGIPIFRTPPT